MSEVHGVTDNRCNWCAAPIGVEDLAGRYRQALEEIAGRGCATGRDACSGEAPIKRAFWCPACIAREALEGSNDVPS